MRKLLGQGSNAPYHQGTLKSSIIYLCVYIYFFHLQALPVFMTEKYTFILSHGTACSRIILGPRPPPRVTALRSLLLVGSPICFLD